MLRDTQLTVRDIHAHGNEPGWQALRVRMNNYYWKQFRQGLGLRFKLYIEKLPFDYQDILHLLYTLVTTCLGLGYYCQ